MSCSRGCARSARCTTPAKITEYPEEAGYWSATKADDLRTVSLDWETYSSERGGITALTHSILPLELCRPCSSAWTRPSTIASRCSSSAASRQSGSPSTRTRSARYAGEVLDGLDGRETCDLVEEVAQPFVARVIGSFMGTTREDDLIWARLMNTILGAGRPRHEPRGRRRP